MMRVLLVTSEYFPLVKTGGLADVSAALPAALQGIGVDARVLLPGYPAVLGGLSGARVARVLDSVPGAGPVRVLAGRLADGVPAYVLDAPSLFFRHGNPYLGPDGHDWHDNPLRFAALGWAASQIGLDGIVDGEGEGGSGGLWRPEIVHGHDWQAGLMPAYLAFSGRARPGTVMTIHNIAYQGQYAPDLLGALWLPPQSFQLAGVEYYGGIGFLKSGLYYADRLTTVSPTYAREIQSGEEGCGLDGLLRVRTEVLSGILNGVDYQVWNPAQDPHLAAAYDADHLAGKALNKRAVAGEFGLEVGPETPLFGLVSRLTWHKGIDLVLAALPELIARGGRLIVLGSGERPLEEGFRRAAAAHPHAVGVRIGYDEGLAHRIQGGADVLLVPSRAEPCGLTQLYGLRYGALPLVRRTGGLEDTVIDATPAALADGCATGIQFGPATVTEFSWGLRRMFDLYRQPERWQQVRRTAMTRDFGWERSARAYLALYRGLREESPAG